jgi:hypothetical protein
MLYSFFCAIPRRLNFMCRRFRTLCSIFIVGAYTTYEDGTDGSVSKRRQIKFRRWGITQKKEYNTWTYFLSVNTTLTRSYKLHIRFLSNARTNINCLTTRPSRSITQLLAAVAVTPGMLTAGEQLFVTDLCLTPPQASPVSPSATDSCCTVRSKYSFNKTATIVYPQRDLYFLQWYTLMY